MPLIWLNFHLTLDLTLLRLLTTLSAAPFLQKIRFKGEGHKKNKYIVFDFWLTSLIWWSETRFDWLSIISWSRWAEVGFDPFCGADDSQGLKVVGLQGGGDLVQEQLTQVGTNLEGFLSQTENLHLIGICIFSWTQSGLDLLISCDAKYQFNT